jgi:hypothetical protein
MRMKQTRLALAVLLFGFAAGLGAAPAGGQGRAGQDTQAGRDDGGAQIIIRSEAEKKRRQQEAADRPAPGDSNRQSDPDATRGLQRSEERRAEAADAHSQAGGAPAQEESGWYEYLFGKRQPTEEKSERDWYEYLFGKRRDADKPPEQEHRKPDDDSSGWWPFD